MSSEPTYFDNSFLDEFKNQKRVVRQKRQHENEAFLFREKCKSIALMLIAVGLLAVLIGLAIYFIRTPRERIVEQVEVPEIIVEIPEIEVVMPEQANSDPDPDSVEALLSRVLESQNSEIQSENAEETESPIINQSVSIFETVTVDDFEVITGRRYEPPFTEGLGRHSAEWCYMNVNNTRNQSVRVGLIDSLGSATYSAQNIQDIMSLSEWNNYRNSCQVSSNVR